MCSKWGIIMFYTSIHSLYLALYALHRDSKVGDGIYKVQVSTTANHVGAVTKAGRLFTWGHGWATMSCGQSESNMAGLLSYSLCVPLLDIIVRQLLTHLDWYQFSAFPLS
jgi:hypothetical protein